MFTIIERPARGGVRRALVGVGSVVVFLSIAGCGSARITADTSCKEYLEQSTETRHEAAVRVSTEVSGVMDAGNPMWGLSVDAACGEKSSMTLGQYFRKEVH